jgi:hypothetical protein
MPKNTIGALIEELAHRKARQVGDGLFGQAQSPLQRLLTPEQEQPMQQEQQDFHELMNHTLSPEEDDSEVIRENLQPPNPEGQSRKKKSNVLSRKDLGLPSPETFADINSIPGETKSQRHKRILEERKQNQHETFEYISGINKAAEGAKDNNKRLKRMEALIDRGNLNSRAWTKFVTGLEGIGEGGGGEGDKGDIGKIIGKILKPFTGAVGTGLRALTFHPDTEEYEKLTNDFLKNAKDVFGARVTNFDIESYLKTIPTLALSDAGKKQIIKNLESFNEASILRQKALRKILARNKGGRPYNIAELVEEEIGPELDRISEELLNRPSISPYDYFGQGRFINIPPEEYEKRYSEYKKKSSLRKGKSSK